MAIDFSNTDFEPEALDEPLVTTSLTREDEGEYSLRPKTLREYIGQEKAKGNLEVFIQAAKMRSEPLDHVLLHGPPGLGKTTLSGIIANEMGVNIRITSGPAIEKAGDLAALLTNLNENDILFVDEIHRFNKAQQDAFLPFVEKGSIILIGATTENPSFEINSALLSRCKVFVLQALSEEDIRELLKHAISAKSGYGGQKIQIKDPILEAAAVFANGDARTALNTLEMMVLNGEILPDGTIRITEETLEQCTSRRSLLYDKKGEEHYNLISALHKSMRNTDPDAAVYWLSRMLEAGEDPLYVARRLIRFASEDVGMADSDALTVAVSAYQACHFIGMPECNVNLAHAVVYLSMAPKSNSLYKAYEDCKEDAIKMLAEPVPLQIRNAPTSLMEELHYGEGYVYAHSTREKVAAMQCLPDSLREKRYYLPSDQGKEAQTKEKLERIRAWKKEQEEKNGKE